LARVLDSVSTEDGILLSMRGDARRDYEAKYTPERGYELMMKAYNGAIANP
jgi:hypothetical protein